MKKIVSLIIALISITAARAQVPDCPPSNFEYVHTNDAMTTRLRPNVFYNAPFGLQGYTFMEFYTDGSNDFYGETYLTKNLGKKQLFGIRADFYTSSFFKDVAGIGFHLNPVKTDNLCLQVKYVPWHWEIKSGHRSKNFGVLGYFLSFSFDAPVIGGFLLTSFQSINLHASDGPTWYYGETYLDKLLGDWTLGIGADFRETGEFWPKANWGLKIGYLFPTKK